MADLIKLVVEGRLDRLSKLRDMMVFGIICGRIMGLCLGSGRESGYRKRVWFINRIINLECYSTKQTRSIKLISLVVDDRLGWTRVGIYDLQVGRWCNWGIVECNAWGRLLFSPTWQPLSCPS